MSNAMMCERLRGCMWLQFVADLVTMDPLSSWPRPRGVAPLVHACCPCLACNDGLRHNRGKSGNKRAEGAASPKISQSENASDPALIKVHVRNFPEGLDLAIRGHLSTRRGDHARFRTRCGCE